MKSKTIIISNQNGKSGRGILTIYDEADLLKCKLRLYNVDRLSPSCRLGLYHNNEVYTANLINRGSFYESSFAGNFDMSLDFYSAIIDIANDNEVLLAGGTYAGFYYEDNSVFKTENNIEATTLEENQETKEPISCDDCDKCAKCKYKEYFYSQQEHDVNVEPQIDPTPQEKSKELISTHTVLDNIIPQFNYIFENYAPNTELNNLISNSKFVSIKDDAEEYSIGAIYEDETLAYICYAVRCNYNTPAPEELGKHHQWLPVDPEDPLSEGYYVVYQDAKDLKIVEM